GQYQKIVLRAERLEPAAPPAQANATTPAAAAGGTAATFTPAATAMTPPAAADATGDATPTPPPPRGRHDSDTGSASAGAGTGRRALKWFAWGTAALSLGVGLYGTVHNSTLVGNFDASCGLDSSGVPRADGPGMTDAGCASLKSRYESAARLG